MATTQIKDGYQGGSDNQLKINSDGSINVSGSASSNIRQEILVAADLHEAITWADFNTSTERITSIVYTSATYSPHTATKTFNYTLTSGAYRLDSIIWTNT